MLPLWYLIMYWAYLAYLIFERGSYILRRDEWQHGGVARLVWSGENIGHMHAVIILEVKCSGLQGMWATGLNNWEISCQEARSLFNKPVP